MEKKVCKPGNYIFNPRGVTLDTQFCCGQEKLTLRISVPGNITYWVFYILYNFREIKHA